MKARFWAILGLALFVATAATAQEATPPEGTAIEWLRIHHHSVGHEWATPIHADSLSNLDLINGFTTLRARTNAGFALPFALSSVDSIDYATTLSDEEEAKDPYRVYQMYVYTANAQRITSRETYVPCYVALNGEDSYASRFVAGQIRGRGNSTWEWYDKKPYRIKLDKKHKMLGMAKAKSWVLLANYRDVTDLMNTFVFELGRWMGLPYTNHTRYVELFVNGDYMGVYQLTEQVQQGESRVAVSDEAGILLALDMDDGPELSPSATDNFWSKDFQLPVVIKYPDDELLTAQRKSEIIAEFAKLEDAIKRKDYEAASQLMDMESMVRYMMIQQLIYNVELSAPRSVFIHKDAGTKWTMGPLWDFDAGYDFDWNDMYHGHDYFGNYRETLFGSNPVKRNSTYVCSRFFTDLFGCKEFVQLYKDTWNHYADSLMSHTWGVMEHYIGHLREGAMTREAQQWPISGKNFETEVAKMKTWLDHRVTYTDNIINAIPLPGEEEVLPAIDSQRLCGTIDVTTAMSWSDGYTQNNVVAVDRQEVMRLMDVAEGQLREERVKIVPLNTDGTEGKNNTKGVFGGWFNGSDNPRQWDGGHVYIEVYEDLFNWNCGVRNDTCYDDEHTVTMQYQYQVGSELRKVNVRVHFTISW